jgi:Ca2+-binding RTX toxin-like protein
VFADGVGITGTIDGGGSTGRDTLNYAAFTTGVTVNLLTGTATKVGGGILNIRDVIGGTRADNLTGDTLNNLLAGNAGNDKLYGGDGSDTLGGGDGNDQIFGEANRDLLFGGLGADTLNGGADEDILFDGTNTFDSSIAALDALLAAWTNTTVIYATRVANLKSGNTGVAGAPRITTTGTTPTVTADNAVDTLTGGAGELDWFLMRISGTGADVVTDLETVLGIDEIQN